MNALEAIAGRSSTRAFRYREVDENAVLTLLEAAVRAPTAAGREPWAFLVVQDRVLLRRVSERARKIWHEESPRREPHELLGVSPASPLANEVWDPTFSIFYGAGTLVVVCSRVDGDLADAECWMATQNLMLAAHALGLGSCVVGAAIPALRTPEIRRELGIPATVRPVSAIILGIPKDAGVPGPRRSPEILAWRR